MKIKELDQHCGNCGVSEYCGVGHCLCTDGRFGDMEISGYKKVAETATGIKKLDVCNNCDRPDCGVYKYSDDDFADEECEHSDEAWDHYCKQIADYVAMLMGGGQE